MWLPVFLTLASGGRRKLGQEHPTTYTKTLTPIPCIELWFVNHKATHATTIPLPSPLCQIWLNLSLSYSEELQRIASNGYNLTRGQFRKSHLKTTSMRHSNNPKHKRGSNTFRAKWLRPSPSSTMTPTVQNFKITSDKKICVHTSICCSRFAKFLFNFSIKPSFSRLFFRAISLASFNEENK